MNRLGYGSAKVDNILTYKKIFVLELSTDTERSERRKKTALASVNTAVLRILRPDEITVQVERAGEAALEERWRRVGQEEGLAVVVVCYRSRHRSRVGIWLWPTEG